MKLLPENIEHLKIAFSKMQSKEDFVGLLNYSNNLIYDEKAFHFDESQINRLSNVKIKPAHYNKFIIKKKTGEDRIIHAPSEEMKAIQKTICLIFQAVFDVHPSATGFVSGKSIVNNAKMHVGNHYVYNIDLKDFFPTITQYRIFKRLQDPPFNLSNENSKIQLASLIANLCCHEVSVKRFVNGEWIEINKSVLPQGAPTSPMLSNIICNKLDFNLTELAKSFGLIYSRYADDITFSSFHNVYQKDGEFLHELHRIILHEGFYINERKTRLQKKEYKQEVTGLIVNEKVNIPSRYVKKLRMWLYLWEHYGYDKASEYFIPLYLKDKGNVKERLPKMDTVIDGKLSYLKMVKGETSSSYLKLKRRFDSLKLINVNKNKIINHFDLLDEIANKVLSDITEEEQAKIAKLGR